MDAKRKTIKIIAALLLLKGTCLCAQVDGDTLGILVAARAMENQVVLRWAPANEKTWRLGNTRGYQVTRTTLTDSGKKLNEQARSNSRIVVANSLFPLPEMAWKPLADTNQLAVIAAASLYSPTFEIPALAATPPDGSNEEDTKANRFSFGLFAADQFLDIAQGMALALVDTSIIPGSIYRYTVTLPLSGNDADLIASDITISADHRVTLRPPSALTAQWRNRGVRLKWDRAKVDTLYSSYYVERSSDSGVTYERINQSPLIYITPEGTYDPFMYYVDSLASNEIEYFYRVRGKTPFGELGPPSESVSGWGMRESLSTPPGIVFMETLPEQSGLWLHWVVDSSAIGRIKGFNVYESLEKGSTQKKVNPTLLTAETLQFVVDQPMHGNYYRIGLLDDTDYELFSTAKLAMLRDDQPPAPPIGLYGKMDTLGKALMTWQSNHEEDLQGYRIYTANHEEGYFAELTYLPVADTFFRHTYSMQTLHEAEYFKVRAIDLRGNYSAFSKAAKISRPDLQPPSAPVFTQVRADDTAVFLRWANSSSPDLAQHTLERRALEEEAWLQLALIEAQGQEEYSALADSSAKPGQKYFYRLIATDKNGLSTASKIIQAGRIDGGRHGVIQNFSAALNPTADKILFSWQFDRMPDVDRFLLYRSQANEPISTYKTLNKKTLDINLQTNTASFEAQNSEKGKHFQYRLLAILKDGTYSNLSDLLFVDH